jgi:GAF domain-containing protein
MPREAELARTLVDLADTLVDDFDVVELLTLLATRCVALLDVDAAGIMLVGPDGSLRVVASSSDAIHVLELHELQAAEGPCLDAHRTDRAVIEGDLDAAGATRWPRFATEAVAAGFRSAGAVPMRLRGTVIGALNLFRRAPGPLEAADLVVAQALADVATIAVLQHRAANDVGRLNEQLTLALDTRVVIEQAKGMVAEHDRISVGDAFAALRRHARDRNLRLADVAERVVDRSLPVEALRAPRPRRS